MHEAASWVGCQADICSQDHEQHDIRRVTTDKARRLSQTQTLDTIVRTVASVLFPPKPRQSQCNLISQLISSFR